MSSGSLDDRPERTSVIAATQPTTGPTAALLTFEMFAVHAIPPQGWTQRTNSINDRSEHITWVSPSGNTAYGVIFFRLPFPVGHELAFHRGFLAEMRKREGEPYVIDKHWDDEIGGLRFTVRGPKYQVEAKFFVKGFARLRGVRGIAVGPGGGRRRVHARAGRSGKHAVCAGDQAGPVAGIVRGRGRVTGVTRPRRSSDRDERPRF